MQRPVKPDAPVLEGTEPWERGVASDLHYDEEDLFKAWYDTPGGVAYATAGRRPLGEAESGDSRV